MSGSGDQSRPDLDCRENIERFVDLFYQRMLADPQLAPIFVDVAEIDLEVHLPHIKDYWCKLLLGENAYQRHTMNLPRPLPGTRPLSAEDFQRGRAFFPAPLEDNSPGERADRAARVAASIAANMQASLPAGGPAE